MSLEDSGIHITKAELIRTKRKYEYSPKVQRVKSLEKLSFTAKELEVLGFVRNDLKPAMVEIVARANHELAVRLRNNTQGFSTQELAVIANLTTQRMLDLEKSGTETKQIDWNKFDLDKFEDTSDVPKGTDNPLE